MEIRNFRGEAIGNVKRVAPAGPPPIWKDLGISGAKRRDPFAKLMGRLRDTLADFIGAIYIDKFSFLPASDAVCEPAMDPLSSGNCPGIAVVIARHNIEEEFHPNDGRRPQRLFLLRNAQRFFLLERSSKRNFVFARRAHLPPRIE